MHSIIIKVIIKKYVLNSFTKFKGKHMCWRLLFHEVADLRHATLLKKSLQYRCFPLNFAKFLRTYFLQNITGRWHLNYRNSARHNE